MKKSILLILSLLYLAGCGNAYIADEIKFKVIFSKQIVQVSFDLSPDQKLSTDFVHQFSNLGIVFLRKNQVTGRSEIGTILSAKPERLDAEWPTSLLEKLGSNNLPKCVPKNVGLHKWAKTDSENEVSLLFLGKPNLITGGAFLSEEFGLLKPNSVIIQNFKAENGDSVGAIALVGKSSNSPGGLYFIANFGENPFLDVPRGRSRKDVVELIVRASEPARVISGKNSDIFQYDDNFLNQLVIELKPLNNVKDI